MAATGKIHLGPAYKLTAIGVGPGDPELITVKGLRAIQAADLICLPGDEAETEDPISRVARRLINSEWQKVLKLPLPLNPIPGDIKPDWPKVAGQIVRQFDSLARAQPRRKEIQGVYLLFEDPLLYGTFVYLWPELLRQHPELKVEIIPGITAFAAAAALAQIPLSTKAERVVILSANLGLDPQQLRQLLTDCEIVVLLDVGPVLPEVLAVLADLRLLDSTHFAERVGMPDEVIVSNVRSLHGQRRSLSSLLIIKTRAKKG